MVAEGLFGYSFFQGGSFTNLYGKFGISGSYRRNNAGQFLATSWPNSYYIRDFSSAPERIIPLKGFSHVNLHGISDTGKLFGDLSGRFGDDDLTQYPHSYDPVTKAYKSHYGAHTGESPSVIAMDDQERVLVDPYNPVTHRFFTPSYFCQGSTIFHTFSNFAPYGMNRFGTVVGAQVSPDSSLVVYKNGVRSVFPEVDGSGFQMSDDETILGHIRIGSTGRHWSIFKNGKVTPLRLAVAGWENMTNMRMPMMRADGKIAVATSGPNGELAALYELTPVPEPASLVALGIGCLALLRRYSGMSPGSTSDAARFSS